MHRLLPRYQLFTVDQCILDVEIILRCGSAVYLKVGEMLRHEAVDLTYWQTACFAIPQSQENENTEKKYSTMKHYHPNKTPVKHWFILICLDKLNFYAFGR